MNDAAMDGVYIYDVESGDEIEGQVVASATTVRTEATLESMKLSEARGKHIQLTLRIPYSAGVHTSLGELFGTEVGAVLQGIEFEEPADDTPGLFAEGDDGPGMTED